MSTALITESVVKSENLQKEYNEKFHVQWKTVQDALDQGYIYPGWNLFDYLKATDKGNPNLPQNPNDPKRVRKPFEYVNVWGVQGASKSSFCLQLLAKLYGDWHTAVDRMLLERDMLIAAYEEVPLSTQRIPAGCLDDLNTIISKQEWFVDKEFYILFHKFLNTIRTKFGTVLSTLPNIQFTPDMLGDIVTFEVIIYPNSTYKVERYCWDIDPWRPVIAKFSKIVVEQAKFDIYKTPPQIWELYQNKRQEVANKLFIQMKEHMEKANKKTKESTALVRKGLREVPIEDVTKEWRDGLKVKLSQEQMREMVKSHRAMIEAKAAQRDTEPI